MKKAQGLSLNTIIIAAIVITVMIVLILVYTGRMGWFTNRYLNQTSSTSCKIVSKDEFDITPNLPCKEGYHLAIGTFDDVGPGEYCCVKNK